MSHILQQLLSQTTTPLLDIALTGSCARTCITHTHTPKPEGTASGGTPVRSRSPFLLFSICPVWICGSFLVCVCSLIHCSVWQTAACVTSAVLRKLFVTVRTAHRCHVSWEQWCLSAAEGDIEPLQEPGRMEGGGMVWGKNATQPAGLSSHWGWRTETLPSLSSIYLLGHPTNCHFSSSLSSPLFPLLPPFSLQSASLSLQPLLLSHTLDGRGFSYASLCFVLASLASKLHPKCF